ncbi:bifunctional phosphopantothenoylcysteine decarboxylase/phosphopantothenate--cysteine ligase CoaBC [Roseateles sp.]|uniref:bifunctional phosphopantothenoylcysteine decarboxylase/phosphopantothenate--cysteine ligase CoaBC n=1 Tax=Roseateles sp. TaxID=1971397 RepID=UPI002DFE101E|nr:bifunctional phosphopantothenoylcysteine decarboxylase/phosphopantothenate--cysteine ligase CoaBC [Roseateles sp.]HEV6965798.1 bifunctional phosphopantothenoylcysteine decarboxylase/phosphopantothenate--cysteine ligase CoaBC [Roseateles sp.]
MTSPLHGKHILLAMTGGIAGYKIAELARLFVKAGATVQVMMTQAAEQFITAVTMQALSGRPVYTSQWDARPANNMAHIELSREADAMLVAPASADAIAALAQGRADDLVSLTALARRIHECPLLVVPAMNREMWAHPATQRNLAQVKADGATVIGPASGDQACGEIGDGRMLEAQEIFDDVEALLAPKPLRGRRLLVTAGPTFEPVDPVRGITNHSSGKMGFAIARAAAEAGAEVTLVAGPVQLATPRGVQRLDVQTAQQMHDAVLSLAPRQDVFIATAAVADWRPAQSHEHKLKKAEGGATAPVIAMAENPDILAAVARLPDPPFCVGFAAESEKLEEHADAKRRRKGIPLIVANLGPATFGRDDNALLLIDERGRRELPEAGGRADKLSLARELIRDLSTRL